MNGTLELLLGKTGISYAAEKGTPGTSEAAIDPADLEVGAIGIYAEIDGKTVLLIEDDTSPTTVTGSKLAVVPAGSAAALKDIDRIFIAEGLSVADGSVRMSDPIFLRNPSVNFRSQEYSAGSAQTTSIGDPTNNLALPGSVVGAEFAVHIWETKVNGLRDSVHVSMEKFNKLDGTGEIVSPTIAQLITEVAYRINQSDLPITATADTTSDDEHIDLVADNVGESFAVKVSGWTGAGSVVITTVDSALPVGSLAHVKAIERKVQEHQGFFSERDGVIPTPASRITATSHDLYTLKYYPAEDDPMFGGQSNVQGNQPNLLYVAMEDGDNDAAGQNQADFQTIITALLGLPGADEGVQEDDAADTA